MKVITVSANTESEQIMVHWPSGDVTFHGIESHTELFKFSWWLFKLAWGQRKQGYYVAFSVDGVDA